MKNSKAMLSRYKDTNVQVGKLKTGIPGYDEISYGGIPAGRSTLISGSAGSGKTIFACQFLVQGILQFKERGVFVSFEEDIQNLKTNVKSFGWNIAEYEDQNLWRFVDASTPFKETSQIIGEFDLSGLLMRISAAVKEVRAKRVVLDSIGALFAYFNDPYVLRQQLYRMLDYLKDKNVTVIITSERLDEYGLVTRFGIEEYITDNVLILRNILENERRRRTIEILKYRGSLHSRGEQAYIINSNIGIEIIPLERIALTQSSSTIRVTSGNQRIDAMCGGGFFKDSIILVSGATGTGKTLTITEFIKGCNQKKQKVLMMAYEESAEQLTRNALGWGVDFTKMIREGRLYIEAAYPESAGLEEHLLNIQRLVEKYRPDRFALDSLSALERGSSKKNFREFLIALTSFLKNKEITSIFTSTNTSIVGGTSVTDPHISTITDSIILLRYAEIFGSIHRVTTILKMRGSRHDKNIYEFDIGEKGMTISDNRFNEVNGILGGVQLPIPTKSDTLNPRS